MTRYSVTFSYTELYREKPFVYHRREVIESVIFETCDDCSERACYEFMGEFSDYGYEDIKVIQFEPFEKERA